MSTAERTREALGQYPFLVLALRAGVLNYRATARFLDIGDADAVAAALRREREAAAEIAFRDLDVRVRLRRTVTAQALADEGLSVPNDDPDEAGYTALTAAGNLPAGFVAMALLALEINGIRVLGHTASPDRAVFAVPDGAAAAALRTVETAAEAVPAVPDSAT